LLITAVPNVKRVGVLLDPRLPSSGPELEETAPAARSLNLELVPAEVQGTDDFEPALREILEQHAGALIVVAARIFGENAKQISDLTTNARLPAMFIRATDAEPAA
jgi:putative ABC transport system substrate-binding protein